MNKILEKISNIPNDKLLHFFWGSILSFVFILILGIKGVFLTFIVAIAKEFYDWYSKKGTPELADFIATIIPAIMFIIVNKI
tara:strand:- start:247 stop:492 length:246 start_codon:yes stop_codon:yes gene_type:complete